MAHDTAKLSQLLAASQKGDKESYREFLSWAYSYAQKAVGRKVFDPDDATDVVQECILAVHKSLRTYDPGRCAKSWFIGLIHHKVVDYIRKKMRIEENEQKDDSLDVTKMGDIAPSTIEAMEIFEGIPESIVKPLVLTKVYGHSTEEAGEILGIKPNALRTRVSRGLKLLRKNLEKANYE